MFLCHLEKHLLIVIKFLYFVVIEKQFHNLGWFSQQYCDKNQVMRKLCCWMKTASNGGAGP